VKRVLGLFSAALAGAAAVMIALWMPWLYMRPAGDRQPDRFGAAIEGPFPGFKDVTGRKVVTRLAARGLRQAVILVAGQSNVTNYVDVPYTPRNRRVLNFDFYNGRVYRARDPMLGTSSDRGSVIGRLGEQLIDRGIYDRVIFVPIAVGATSAAMWSDGAMRDRIDAAKTALRAAGLRVDLVLWHQGESDAQDGTPADIYRARLARVIAHLHELTAGPVFVAQASICGDTTAAHRAAIRTAQRSLVDGAGVRAGPDTDVIAERYDGCHFNGRGADRHAALWADVLARYAAGHGPQGTR
jgi:hypothetical protein